MIIAAKSVSKSIFFICYPSFVPYIVFRYLELERKELISLLETTLLSTMFTLFSETTSAPTLPSRYRVLSMVLAAGILCCCATTRDLMWSAAMVMWRFRRDSTARTLGIPIYSTTRVQLNPRIQVSKNDLKSCRGLVTWSDLLCDGG